jgi:glycosyltransferase involved in cell wall biosynthesis
LAGQGISVTTQVRPPANLRDMIWRRIKTKLGSPRPEFALLKSKRPDLVVISQGYNRDGLEWMNVCRELELPYVAIVQCNSESWWPADQVSSDMARAYRSAQKVFCVSQHNLRLLESQIGEVLPKGKVVWNPFNVTIQQPPDWPDASSLCKLACVARLEPAAKGQDLLLQVLALPAWRERPIELNIYGTGASEIGLQKLAQKLKLENVHFHGHVANIQKIWEQNHLLVLPSRFEGLPLALVEAMWCARPAVVTDIGGNTELCIDGKTGFVATAPNVSLIAEALERAWHRRADWEKMGKVARLLVDKLVPKDPVEAFCQELLTCAVPKSPHV